MLCGRTNCLIVIIIKEITNDLLLFCFALLCFVCFFVFFKKSLVKMRCVNLLAGRILVDVRAEHQQLPKVDKYCLMGLAGQIRQQRCNKRLAGVWEVAGEKEKTK